MSYTLSVGSSYTFTMRAAAIFGSEFTNAKLIGKASMEVALLVDNVAQLHAQALPYLPSGTSADPASLNYLIITTITGERRVIAEEWLTAQPTQTNTSIITLRCLGTPADLTVFQAILAENNKVLLDYAFSN
jgi:hypothetical protein